MIGVIAKASELGVVEEFFQLFKTPWEIFLEGRSYEVIVAASGEVPEGQPGLQVIYGSDLKKTDGEASAAAPPRLRGVTANYRGSSFPIYGDVLAFERSGSEANCLTANGEIIAFKTSSPGRGVVRFGYNLFEEVERLLSVGQPVQHAHAPTLEFHIAILRDAILDARLGLVEILPVPAGYEFSVCLTHDIDFVGIRNHKFDHTMWGFLYRSTVGAVSDLVRGRTSIRRLLGSWQAAASLPFVYLGLARDFWLQFDWYLEVEKDLPCTYFFIPFKGRAGDKVGTGHAARRAAAYDITDLPELTATLTRSGCEIGVHGIDAWHSAERGREELSRVAAASGGAVSGVRMHWLLRDASTFRVLEEAGYAYDSTVGYNETVGYRCGTGQAFRPPGTQRLLELPLHIQDGALFYRQRLGLSESEAWARCESLVETARRVGGVLTVLWHDRSPGPERFWGDFYASFVAKLRSLRPWFGTAAQVVGWFGKRRQVVFERIGNSTLTKPSYRGEKIVPPLTVRVHRPGCAETGPRSPLVVSHSVTDLPWSGESGIELTEMLDSGAASLYKTVSLAPGLA
jgi:hypothetical protein